MIISFFECPRLFATRNNLVFKKFIISTTALLLISIAQAHAFLSTSENINPKDYPFLLMAEDLMVYHLKLDLSGDAEKAFVKKWINGAYDIKYEYDRRDDDRFNKLFFSAKLEVDKTAAKAKEAYREGLFVIKKMSASVNMPYREIKNIIGWGDESYYALRERKGKPLGLIFTTRRKNKVYTIIMVGLYSSDHSLITDLVLPKLQHIDSFQLKK